MAFPLADAGLVGHCEGTTDCKVSDNDAVAPLPSIEVAGVSARGGVGHAAHGVASPVANAYILCDIVNGIHRKDGGDAAVAPLPSGVSIRVNARIRVNGSAFCMAFPLADADLVGHVINRIHREDGSDDAVATLPSSVSIRVSARIRVNGSAFRMAFPLADGYFVAYAII